MKKVGIITFHRALNYGAVLQTYALANVLQEQGFDVSVIDYRCRAVEDIYRPFYAKECKTVNTKIKKLLKSFQFIRRKKQFDAFIDSYIPVTASCRNREELEKIAADFDIIITGSDQVFNLGLSGGESAYFLDFVPDGIKKVSYAASFGVTELTDSEQKIIKPLIERFDMITLREKSGIELLHSVCGIDAPCAIDPTLLLKKEKWEALAEKPKGAPEKYILVVILGNCRLAVDKAKSLAKKADSSVVIINPTLSQQIHCRDCILYTSASPAEYLWLISHAEAVISTSFHGLALSLALQKEVYAEVFTENVSSRITDLLDTVGLSSRLLPNQSHSKINWEQVEKALVKNRYESKHLLLDMCDAYDKLR